MEDAPPHMQFRDYKEFFERGLYHIYNRGHNKMVIFRDQGDYKFFLERLEEILNLRPTKSRWLKPLPKGSFTILAYCLMPNHFHLLVKQESRLPVSKLLSKLLTSYGIYFNRKYNQVGTIFQDQFKSKQVDNDEYLAPLSAYIHRNPPNFLSWPFSSLPSYLGDRREALVDSSLILSIFNKSREQYQKYVKNYRKAGQAIISDLRFDEE